MSQARFLRDICAETQLAGIGELNLASCWNPGTSAWEKGPPGTGKRIEIRRFHFEMWACPCSCNTLDYAPLPNNAFS